MIDTSGRFTHGATMIEFRDVSKRYGSVRALDSVSFTVERGEVFGYIGPNGAGKTTSIKILTGLVRDYEGAVRRGTTGRRGARLLSFARRLSPAERRLPGVADGTARARDIRTVERARDAAPATQDHAGNASAGVDRPPRPAHRSPVRRHAATSALRAGNPARATDHHS